MRPRPGASLSGRVHSRRGCVFLWVFLCISPQLCFLSFSPSFWLEMTLSHASILFSWAWGPRLSSVLLGYLLSPSGRKTVQHCWIEYRPPPFTQAGRSLSIFWLSSQSVWPNWKSQLSSVGWRKGELTPTTLLISKSKGDLERSI